jgi:acetyl esterase/lipase
MPKFFLREAEARGWSYLSADYRLLVPASGHDILEDVSALFDYIAKHLPQVDTSRIAVIGSSAGAYPARLAGLYANPKPKAIVSMYGSMLRIPLPL